MNLGIRTGFVVLVTADMNYDNSAFGKGIPKVPVVAIDCVQDRRVVWMCQCESSEHAVGKIKTCKRWIVRELGIISFSNWMGRKFNMRDPIYAVPIVDQPLKEQIPHARLTSK